MFYKSTIQSAKGGGGGGGDDKRIQPRRGKYNCSNRRVSWFPYKEKKGFCFLFALKKICDSY